MNNAKENAKRRRSHLEPPVGSKRARNLAKKRKRYAEGKNFLRPYDDMRLEGDLSSDFAEEETTDAEAEELGWNIGGSFFLETGQLGSDNPPARGPRSAGAGSSNGGMDSIAAAMATSAKAKERQVTLEIADRAAARADEAAEKDKERAERVQQRAEEARRWDMEQKVKMKALELEAEQKTKDREMMMELMRGALQQR